MNAGDSSAASLEFRSVTHWYEQVVAINDLTFSVGAGITGLLGPNGAGKSTLLALAAGLQQPGSGAITVFGKAPSSGPGIYRDIALVPVGESLPARLTIRQFVEGRAVLLGVGDPVAAAARSLAAVEMDTISNRRIGGLSKGMTQRVKLAAALVHEPRLILLDEPFNGLDPLQRMHMMRMLRERAANGTAVLLSSHILEEIQDIATRILVIYAGRLAASGDYRELRRLMTDRPLTVKVRTSDDRRLASELIGSTAVAGLDITAAGLTIRTGDYQTFARLLAPGAKAAGVSIFDVQLTDDSLEHVFSYLVVR